MGIRPRVRGVRVEEWSRNEDSISGARGLRFRDRHPTMHASYESRDGMRTAAAARPGSLPIA